MRIFAGRGPPIEQRERERIERRRVACLAYLGDAEVRVEQRREAEHLAERAHGVVWQRLAGRERGSRERIDVVERRQCRDRLGHRREALLRVALAGARCPRARLRQVAEHGERAMILTTRREDHGPRELGPLGEGSERGERLE